MKQIRQPSFCGHPSVAPVITLHVFKTRVTVTASKTVLESMKALDKKLANSQKSFDKLHGRLAKLEKKN